MRLTERLFVWAGGYSPRALANERDEDREPIAKLGGAVLLAAAIAAANWGIAGFAYAEGLSDDFRMVAAALACLVGIAIVMVIDRTGLFYFDIMDRRPTIVTLWIALRIALILAISSLTAKVVVPALLRSELQVHALHLQEQADAWRLTELNTRFKLPE